MQAFFQSVVYWKMATVRAILYMLIVSGGTFMTLTETYTGEEWQALSMFEACRVYAASVIAGVTTLIAFLDQTMSRLSNESPKTEQPK